MSDDTPPPDFDGKDRGISPVSGRPRLGRRGQVLGLTALAALGGMFVLASGERRSAKAAPPLQPVRQIAAFEPASPQAPPEVPPSASAGPASATAPLVSSAAPGPQVPAIATAASTSPASRAESGLASADAPLMAYSREAAVRPAAPSPSPVATAPGDGIATAKAHRLAHPSWMILAGSTMPCVLLSSIDSALPGPVSCMLPRDVYSENAGVVLLEKGTRVTGEYVGLKRGQERLMVRWTRAVTPGGVAIALGSPAGDALGRAGLDGARDDHLMGQFGGAVLMSLVDGAMAAIGRSASTLSLSLPSRASEVALRSGLQTAPTLRRAAGSQVTILVAQDLDFSEVYDVAASR